MFVYQTTELQNTWSKYWCKWKEKWTSPQLWLGNSFFLVINKVSRQKISNNKELNSINQKGVIDMYRTLHPTTAEHTLFSSAHRASPHIDRILGHKTNLKKIKRVEIIQSVFSDQSGLKLEISNKKVTRKSPKTWKWIHFCMIHGSRGSLKGNFLKRHPTKWSANISEFAGCSWRNADRETHSTECLLGSPCWVCTVSLDKLGGPLLQETTLVSFVTYSPCGGCCLQLPGCPWEDSFHYSVILHPQMPYPGDWEQLREAAVAMYLFLIPGPQNGFCRIGS